MQNINSIIVAQQKTLLSRIIPFSYYYYESNILQHKTTKHEFYKARSNPIQSAQQFNQEQIISLVYGLLQIVSWKISVIFSEDHIVHTSY